MTIAVQGVNNSAGETNGVSGTGVATVTPTMPASTANGDRIFVYVMASGLFGTPPASWTVLTQDVQCGSGTIANNSGLRYQSVFYRDRDAGWSAMPAFSLASRANPGMIVCAIGLRPTSGSTFDTPVASTTGGSYNAASTSYTDDTAASFTTHSNGLLLLGTVFNSQIFSTSSPAVSQSGATFGTVTSRCLGSLNTGDDSTGRLYSAPVTTGAAAIITHTMTLGSSSQGETLVVEQTESAGTPTFNPSFFAMF